MYYSSNFPCKFALLFGYIVYLYTTVYFKLMYIVGNIVSWIFNFHTLMGVFAFKY